MADIQRELDKIKAAVYGGEVRTSIHDGIKKINDAVEEVEQEMEEWTQGNLDETLKSPSLPPKSSVVGDKITSLENVVADKDSFLRTATVSAKNVVYQSETVTADPKTYSNIRTTLTGTKTNGYSWDAATKAPVANEGHSYLRVDGVSSYSIIYVDGYHQDNTTYPLAAFYNASEELVSKVEMGVTNSGILGYEVVVPEGASYIVVNGISNTVTLADPVVKGLSGTNSKVGTMRSLSGVLYSGKAWNTNGTETSGADFMYLKYKTIPNASRIYVTGASFGYGYKMIAFYDATDTLLSSYINSGSTFCYAQEIVVPSGASYFIVNGSAAATFVPFVEYPVARGEDAPIRNLEAELNPYYLFVGDSYGEGYSHDGNNPGWISYLVSYLGLEQDEYASTYHGGDGFANGGFNSQLNAMVNASITDVVICGGYNDSLSTEAQILTGIQNCVNTAKSKWVGAKVHIGFVGHNKAGNGDGAEANWQNIRTGMLSVAMPAYKKCVSKGAEYMAGVETWLTDSDMTNSDGYHPSAVGNSKIAMAIANALKTGSAGDGIGVEKGISELKSALEESVRFDIAQDKTEEEKAQARANIGVGNANNELLWNIFYSCLHDVAWKTDKGLRVIEMVYDNLYKDIPENYTLLDYIESDSSKVVNTGILSQVNISIEMICSLALKFYEHSGSSSNTYNLRDFGPIVTAAGTNDPAGRFYAFGVVAANYTSPGASYEPYYAVRYGNTAWSLSAERENAFHKHDLISVESIFSSSAYKLIVNNEVVVQGSVSNVNYGNSIYLFSNPYAFSTADHTNCKSCRIYGVNIKSNGIALFDGVPVYDKASGLGGLYDTIGKAFHPLTPLEYARS